MEFKTICYKQVEAKYCRSILVYTAGTLTPKLRVFTTLIFFKNRFHLRVYNPGKSYTHSHSLCGALQSDLRHQNTLPQRRYFTRESSESQHEICLTCILLSATFLSDNWNMPRTKMNSIDFRINTTRERVVNTLLGVRVPPVAVKAVNTINIISVREKVREIARL